MSTTDVVSINALNVAAGSGYLTTLVQSYVQPESAVSRAQRDGDAPLVTNAAPGVLEVILTVIVDARGADADTVDARRRALLRALDTSAAPLTLVIKNAKGTARERYMRFVVIKTDQAAGQFGEGFAAQLNSADDVRWRATARVEETHTFTESGVAWQINVLGDLETYPTYTLTPREPRGTPVFPYFKPFTIRWRSPWGGEHPVDITDGGLNTAALKTAGKVTNSSNIGVMLDGRYVPFWYGAADAQPGGFNSSTTRLWVNMTFQPATAAATTRYTAETDTTIYIRNDANLPQSGTLLLDGEYVTFAFRSPGVLYGVQRGQYGSTAEAHVAGSSVEPVRVGYIFYGPAGAVPEAAKDYDYNNAKPPLFLGGGSTNEVWDFTGAFNDPAKTGNWRYDWWGNSGTAFVSASTASGAYNPAWVSPWTAMGFKPGWASHSGFSRMFAIPIRRARVTGRRYAAGSTAQYPSSPKLHFANQMGEGAIVWESGNGIERLPNPAFDVTTADATAMFNRISWFFQNTNFAQADIQRLVVTFRGEYLPVIDIGAEDTGYDLDLQLSNNSTGETLWAEYPNMLVDEGLVIDSEQMTVTYQGRNVYSAVRRGGIPFIRPHFLRLAPGANVFYVDEDGIGSLELKVSYEPRWYA